MDDQHKIVYVKTIRWHWWLWLIILAKRWFFVHVGRDFAKHSLKFRKRMGNCSKEIVGCNGHKCPSSFTALVQMKDGNKWISFPAIQKGICSQSHISVLIKYSHRANRFPSHASKLKFSMRILWQRLIFSRNLLRISLNKCIIFFCSNRKIEGKSIEHFRGDWGIGIYNGESAVDT